MKKLFICLLLACFLFVPVQAKSSYVDDLTILCDIDEAGTAHFQETIDLYAYQGTEYYQVFHQMHDMELTLEEVSDETGQVFEQLKSWNTELSRKKKKGKCGVIRDGDHYELCFGIGDYGHHQFTVSYTISKFVFQYASSQGVNYAFLSGLNLKVNHFKAYVKTITPLSKENARIWGFGFHGTVEFQDDGVVVETSESFKGRKIQLLMEMKEASYRHPCYYYSEQSFEEVLAEAKKGSSYQDSDDTWIYVFVVVFTFLLCIIVALIIFLITKVGKIIDSRPQKLIYDDQRSFDTKQVHFFRDIPCDKNIPLFFMAADQLGIIDDDKRANLLSSYILSAIQKDQISFSTYEKSHFLHKTQEFKMDLSRFEANDAIESELIRMLREGAGEDGVLESKEFRSWCYRNYKDLEDWEKMVIADGEAQLDERYRTRIEEKERSLFFFTKTKVRYVYNAAYRNVLEEVYGFYRFLKDQHNMAEKEVIEVKLWDEYLVFATLLGIAEEVEKQIKVVCPNYRSADTYNPYYIGYCTRRMCTKGSYAAMSAANAGSGGSSSYGGGGGGFSGGGGGGLR